MNKKDISMVKKVFKLNNDRLILDTLYTACIKQNGEVLYEQNQGFDFVNDELSEIYFKNFRKAFAGNLDTKLFELEFDNELPSNIKDNVVSLKNDINEHNARKLIDNIASDYRYDSDILVSILNGNMSIPFKNRHGEKEETSYDFVVCLINKVAFETPKLSLNVPKKEIGVNRDLSILTVKSPIEGFIYPSYSEGYIFPQNVMYSTFKANTLNHAFLSNVIGCRDKLTAIEEKKLFNEVLKSAMGTKVSTNTLHGVYSELLESKREEESDIVSAQDINRVLKSKGIDEMDKIKNVLEHSDVISDSNFDFKIDNIVPKKSKEIKILNNNIEVSLSSNELDKIKQINNNGKRCLVIELDEDVDIDGFKLKNDKL